MLTKKLPVVGDPSLEQRLLIRDAKMSLDLDFLIHLIEATPGATGPYLAFEHPRWFPPDGYAYVRTVDSIPRMRVALQHLYGLTVESRITTPEMWLSRVLQCDVVEVA